MSEFIIDVETDLPPAVAWERLWDLDRHTATIPLTRVTVDAPSTQLGEGVGFTGRTALGPLGFDDTMRVEMWRPPAPQATAPSTAPQATGRAVVVKTGRLLGGRIEVELVPPSAGDGRGSAVHWRQEVRLPWLPRPLRWIEAIGARLVAPGYRWVLGRLLA
ncbi:hypothetical protein [Janibacter anophelis]|uniref:hypothetical protein n=1 Tax=Janibacter anophelis TaxID=319054 RepID=UPI00082C6A39|nr:hypothetical protein [Janibacter anophelis]